MRCAAARICSPSLVTRRPSTWRVNSVTPSCASAHSSIAPGCTSPTGSSRTGPLRERCGRSPSPAWPCRRRRRGAAVWGVHLTEHPCAAEGTYRISLFTWGFARGTAHSSFASRHFGHMRIFLLTGVVSALSPGIPKADRVAFDFVEITKAAGMRIRLENISVSAQVAKIFELDSIGKFYFLGDGPNHYLLGIERADGVQAFDPRDISLDDLRNFIEGN